MNDHEAERIAAAMNQARPDWPVKQLRTLLADPRIAERPRRDVFVALAWVACESNTATPYRVLEAGPWWRACSIEDGHVPRPPRVGEFCHYCGRALDGCTCGQRDPRPPQPTADAATWAERIRADLRGGAA